VIDFAMALATPPCLPLVQRNRNEAVSHLFAAAFIILEGLPPFLRGRHAARNGQ
jgi:hypothetical protein